MALLVGSVPLSCEVLFKGDMPKTGPPENEMLRSLIFILQLGYGFKLRRQGSRSKCGPTPWQKGTVGGKETKNDSGGLKLFLISLLTWEWLSYKCHSSISMAAGALMLLWNRFNYKRLTCSVRSPWRGSQDYGRGPFLGAYILSSFNSTVVSGKSRMSPMLTFIQSMIKMCIINKRTLITSSSKAPFSRQGHFKSGPESATYKDLLKMFVFMQDSNQ